MVDIGYLAHFGMAPPPESKALNLRKASTLASAHHIYAWHHQDSQPISSSKPSVCLLPNQIFDRGLSPTRTVGT